MWEVMLRPQEGQCSSGVLQMKHVLHLILWVGDVTLVLKAAKTPSLTDLFLFYTLSPLGWSRSPSRCHTWERFQHSPPPLPSWVILSHTSLTSPINVTWFPTVLGRFISIFPCQLSRLPTALCWTAALCALLTCSKLLFLDKARRQTSFIKVRTWGRAQLISTYPWRTSRWKWGL